MLLENRYPEKSFNDVVKETGMDLKINSMGTAVGGIGSKIEVEAGGKKMICEIDGGGSGHISQNSVIAHFGLWNTLKIDKINVYWTGGNKQTITDVKVNQRITITEIPQEKSNHFFIYLLIGMTCLLVGFKFLKKRKII